MPNQIIGIDISDDGVCEVKGTRIDDGTVVIEEVKFSEPEWWRGYVSKSDERMVNVLYIPDIIAEATYKARIETWEEAKALLNKHSLDVFSASCIRNDINSRIQQYGKK